MAGQPPPSFSDDEVVKALRAAGAKGLMVHPRAQSVLNALQQYDISDVSEWVAECVASELHKHELDYDYPARQDYIAVLNIHLPGEPLAFYVKIALQLPHLAPGKLISLRLWT